MKTKLRIPPLNPGLIPCLHLVERLDSGLEEKLTLVSLQIRSIQTPSAWYAVSEIDHDLSRLFASLSVAIQSRYPDCSEVILDLDPGPDWHRLDHGSDETNTLLNLTYLQAAASLRCEECLTGGWEGDMLTTLEWKCIAQ